MKWEYKIQQVYDEVERTLRTLNDLGNDGWEVLGSLTPTHLLLKRPKKCEKCGE
jgi:hypothetical protein